jgi:hypothetical protein
MERFTSSKKTSENARYEKAEFAERVPGDLTPEQEAELREALVSIDSPNTQKKSI